MYPICGIQIWHICISIVCKKKHCKQPNGPSSGEWIGKLRYRQTWNRIHDENNWMTAIQVPTHTEWYHFYKVQKHAKLKNTLFRNAYMCSKTIKKDKYKLQADGYLYEREGRTEDLKGIDNIQLLKLVGTWPFIKLLFIHYWIYLDCWLIEYICVYIYMHVYILLTIYFIWINYLIINKNSITNRYIWEEKLPLIYLWLSDMKHAFLLTVGTVFQKLFVKWIIDWTNR